MNNFLMYVCTLLDLGQNRKPSAKVTMLSKVKVWSITLNGYKVI